MNFFQRLLRPTGVDNYNHNPRAELGRSARTRPNPIMDIGASRFDFPAVTGVAGNPSVRQMEKPIEMNAGVSSRSFGARSGNFDTWTYNMSNVGGSGFDLPRFFARERGSEIF